MAVGETGFPELKIAGVKLGTALAGIKQKIRDDILLIELAPGSRCTAVFTQNKFCAAPVQVAQQHLFHSPRWLLVNSGNANAGTGRQGLVDAQQCCRDVADLVGGQDQQVMPFSTGVIGETLPVEKIQIALQDAVVNLDEKGWEKAAAAIMTTDTRPKGASKTIQLGGKNITIGGIAKGAGMIQPNMATMLAFIATDAAVNPTAMGHCLGKAVENSFNCITIDGDTSTNDACVLMATGCADNEEIRIDGPEYVDFTSALTEVCQSLAEAIVRDGEGATKLIRISVESAATNNEARLLAKTVAHSPLVKTAFFASDPNWGRVLAVIGRAEIESLDIHKVSVWLDEVCIVASGEKAQGYSESAGQTVMIRDEITVRIMLGRGDAIQTVLTCDLSYDYVRINAEYRT